MLATLVLVFREALEAGLIVGVVLAATVGVRGRGRWVAGGVGFGVAGACVVAGFAGSLTNAFDGVGHEMFTAVILLAAVAMLAWHTIWMARHGREMAGEMRAVGSAVKRGDKPLFALAIVVGVAVLREGSELVLFLYGVVLASGDSRTSLLAGGVLGLGLAVLAAWGLYRGLVAIPMRHLFSVTSMMIALLAAGMAGQAASVLAGADIIPSWGDEIWNSSAFLSDDTLAGRTMHVLIGYSARPAGVQLAAYVATLVLLVGVGRRGGVLP